MKDFNAAKAFKDYKRNYLEFLVDRTIGGVPQSEGETEQWNAVKKQLLDTWKSDDPRQGLFAKPILEGLFPYPDCGKKFSELIVPGEGEADSVFDPRMNIRVDPELASEAYNLYAHQLEAVKQVNAGKNIIVSSGTGSGKTECFLYSMLNQLLRTEDEESLNEPGVRVLMIYPMNALVKDQLKRIVELLNRQDLITVGMYTSQTPNSYSRGRLDPWAIDPNANGRARRPYRCLRASRKDIRQSPPHILITNYSMLEYMMLRSKDHAIFDANKLKAIVLDEAHLYTGNLANDINMLIRRTLLRMNKRPDEIRFYATSATIGDGSPASLRTAAAGLFGVPESTIAPITGDRDFPAMRSGDACEFDEEADEVIVADNATGEGLSDEEKARLSDLRHRLIENNNHLLVNDIEIALLGKALEAGASYRKRTASGDYKDTDASGKPFVYLPFKLHCFVDSPRYFYSDLRLSRDLPLGNLSRERFFDGDLEGLQVFTTDQKRKDIYFKARARFVESGGDANWYFYNDDLDGDEIKTAEGVSVDRDKDDATVAIFRFCVAGFDDESVGFNLERSGGCWKFVAGTQKSRGSFVLAIKDVERRADIATIASLTEVEWYSAQGSGEKLKIFGIQKDSEVDDGDDGFDDDVDDNQTAAYSSGHMLMPLGLVIESLRSQLTAELLFPNLADAKKKKWKVNDGAGNIIEARESDEDYANRLMKLPWRGRQMLVFADSRRNAANAALLMQDKHQREYIKSCIYNVLNQDAEAKLSFSAISSHIAADNETSSQLVLPQWMMDKANDEQLEGCKEKMIKGLVANELLRKPSDRGLEGCGAITHVVSVANNSIRRPRMAEAGLPAEWADDDTMKNVLVAVADLMREKRCIYIRDWYDKEIREDNYPLRAYFHGLSYLGKRYHRKDQRIHEAAAHVGGDGIIHMYPDGGREVDPAPFVEFEHTLNYKGELASRIISMGLAINEENARAIVAALGRYVASIAVLADAMGEEEEPARVLFVKDRLGDDARIAINADAFKFSINSGEVADQTFDFKQNTGNKQTMFPGCDHCWDGLRVPEHSAQLDVFRLSQIEQKFRDQEINVISCTPTMEVGVDIGGLSVVALQGVPPERANYFQRVGRAGRRDQSSALALTMTGKGGNSDAIFENPERIFMAANLYRDADVITPISREQVKKHIFQYLIGCAFQKERARLNTEETSDNPIKAWEKVGNFFATCQLLTQYISWLTDDEDDERNLANEINGQLQLNEAFCDYVASLTDAECSQYKQLIERTSCSDLSFDEALSELVDKLTKCKNEFNLEMGRIVEQANLLEDGDEEAQRRSRALKRQFFTMYKKELIASLAHKRIIPAFGFPIDVLSFAAGDKTSIERDAATAIREFVPGASFTVGHAKYRVDALGKNYYSNVNGLYEEFYLCHCEGCNGTFISPTQDFSECKICHKHRAIEEEDEEDRINAEEENGGESNEVVIDVRRYVVPRNYVSFQSDATDAVTTTSGFVWAKTDEKLIIGNPAVALNLRRSTKQDPAPMSFDVIPSTSGKVHSVVYNSGTMANGYLINTVTGQILSKPRDEDEVGRICGKWEERNPGLSIQGRSGTHGVDLAFESQIGAFVIGVPCYDGAGDLMVVMPSLRKLLLMAFLKKASEMLRVDARLLKKYNYVWKDGNSCTALLCIYDSSGNDNYLIELKDRKDELRDAVIGVFGNDRTVAQIREDIYCYANSYDFASITDTDIVRLKEWIGNNREKMIQGDYRGILGKDSIVHRVNKLAAQNDPVAALTAADSVTIFVDECNPESLTAGAIMTALQRAANINVVYDEKALMPDAMTAGEGVSMIVKLAAVKLRNRLRDRIGVINNVHVYLGRFDAEDALGAAYDFGVRLIINDDQYVAFGENDECLEFPLLPKGNMNDDEYKKYEKTAYAKYHKSISKVVDGKFAIAISGLTPFDLNREDEPELPGGGSVVEILSNTAYSDKPVPSLWADFHLDIATVELLEYSDVYFKSVRAWRGLSLLMEGVKFSNGAKVSIVTAAIDDKKDKYAYDFRGRGLGEVRCDGVVLGSSCFVAPTEAQDLCAEYLGRRFACATQQGAFVIKTSLPVEIKYSDDRLPHARLMTVSYVDSNGVKRKARFAFDKGMDFIRYDRIVAKNCGLHGIAKIKLFDDVIKNDLYYDYTLIFLIEDKEIE